MIGVGRNGRGPHVKWACSTWKRKGSAIKGVFGESKRDGRGTNAMSGDGDVAEAKNGRMQEGR
jgi:hypothetical protein